jgi:hypothetical protein
MAHVKIRHINFCGSSEHDTAVIELGGYGAKPFHDKARTALTAEVASQAVRGLHDRTHIHSLVTPLIPASASRP